MKGDAPTIETQVAKKPRERGLILSLGSVAVLTYLHISSALPSLPPPWLGGNSPSVSNAEQVLGHSGTVGKLTPYGIFPAHDDPFHFVPCTERSVLPPLDQPNPLAAWVNRIDEDPGHWNWGKAPESKSVARQDDPYAGRGIFLCGYLDVPLDYTNKSDERVVRLSINRYQVSGLAHSSAPVDSTAGKKSKRTIVINPGGPGGSGTMALWYSAEAKSKRFSDGQFDVLGFDPRGVNTSLPAASCYPYDADRDRWTMPTSQYREVSGSPRNQLEFADAMYDATMGACWERLGDLGRFLSTAFVARDVEEIRKALGEDELTAAMVSYGTGIGQTYVNMFPDRAGRILLDGTEYVRDHRELGGFGWTALDNTTDAWNEGFLGECVDAGPEFCALAKPINGTKVTLPKLKARMKSLFDSLAQRPLPAYTTQSGPSLITYSDLVGMSYGAMYGPRTWKGLAEVFSALEIGNTTSAARFLEANWEFNPTLPCTPQKKKPSTEELTFLVVCSDAYDAPQKNLQWWDSLWSNMTAQSWIAGNSRFSVVLPCRQFNKYWPEPAEVYRGPLNHTLNFPTLLIAETYDPATPLRNGRRLLNEMGKNARLVVHHGYGHSSQDTSACTDKIAKAYILNGTVPDSKETDCYADEKPYRYKNYAAMGAMNLTETGRREVGSQEIWQQHVKELLMLAPHVLRGMH